MLTEAKIREALKPLCSSAQALNMLIETSMDEYRAIEQAVRLELQPDTRDAKRYRWLRDESVPPHNFYLSVPIEFDGVRYGPHEVDAYIDAARGQTCGG